MCCYHSFPHPCQTLVSHWPPASDIGMLLVTFAELRVVAGRSRKRAGSPQAVSRRTCCAVAMRRTAWSEHGMASVNQTRPHCVNQMGKTHSKPLAARHAVCESAFNVPRGRKALGENCSHILKNVPVYWRFFYPTTTERIIPTSRFNPLFRSTV